MKDWKCWTALFAFIVVAVTASAQTPMEPPAPTVAPQVRPALPQGQTPDTRKQEALLRAKTEAEARWALQAQERRRLQQETRLRGYWIDTVTKLMWAAQDNGEPVTWRKATGYCKELRLAGYSNWRLATLDELASLVDKDASAPVRVDNTEIISLSLGASVRGGLTLSGNPWSSTREINRFGKPYGDGWFFDFVNSKPSGDLPYFRNTKYALCVRPSQ